MSLADGSDDEFPLALESTASLPDSDTLTPVQKRSLRPRNSDGTASTSSSLKRRRGRQDSQAAAEEQLEQELEDNDGHSDKKRRSSASPSENDKTPTNAGVRKNRFLRSRPSRKSMTPKRLRAESRASHFLEGSMNDKVSNPPPSEFTDHDSAMQNYMDGNEAEAEGGATSSNDKPAIQHKPSGVFRFGKAIANALNPRFVWQGVSGMWRDNQEETGVARSEELEERKAQADKMYQEFSKSGFFAANAAAHAQEHEERAIKIKQEPVDDDDNTFSAPPSRDSGIALSDNRSSNETKRDDLTVDNPTLNTSQDSWTAPSLSTPWTSTHTLVNDMAEDTPRPSHKRRPSMSSLKKVASRFNLKGLKSTDPTSLDHTTERGPSPIKKMLSKKDLQKQEKLNKKISNLEAQLLKARQELGSFDHPLDVDGYDSAPPLPPLPTNTPIQAKGPSKFKPSKLPTILSERMITTLVDNNNPMTYSFSSRMNRARSAAPTSTAAMIEDSLRRSERKRRPSSKIIRASTEGPVLKENKPANKKRKSLEALDVQDKIEAAMIDQGKEHKKAVGRPRKSIKVEREASPAPSIEDNVATKAVPDYTAVTTPDEKFDPSMIDESRILGLRKSASNKPFLSTNEDIANLHMIYPNVEADQLATYMDKRNLAPVGFKTSPIQKEVTKPTESDNLLFQNGKPTTVLAPPNGSSIPAPVSASTTKRTLRRKSSRVFSSPPPGSKPTGISKGPTPSPRRSLSGARGSRGNRTSPDSPITVTPSNRDGVPPVPAVPAGLKGKRARLQKNTATKSKQHAEWKGWDEDVF